MDNVDWKQEHHYFTVYDVAKLDVLFYQHDLTLDSINNRPRKVPF